MFLGEKVEKPHILNIIEKIGRAKFGKKKEEIKQDIFKDSMTVCT